MTLLTMTLLLASSLQVVEYDPEVDFSRYKTWSWQADGTAAADPVVDKRIRDALARGLAARGLSSVGSDATLLVRYHAARTKRIEIVSRDPGFKDPPTGIRYAETGSLVVELLDAASGKVVWRGQATGVLKYGPQEIKAQIDAAVAELLAAVPAGH